LVLSSGGEAKPSNVRIFLVDILTFHGFFGVKFDILKPRWLPTAMTTECAATISRLNCADSMRSPGTTNETGGSDCGHWLNATVAPRASVGVFPLLNVLWMPELERRRPEVAESGMADSRRQEAKADLPKTTHLDLLDAT
jgi:hypothetical protein